MHTTPKSCAQQSVAIFAYIAAAGMLYATVAPESELEATKPTVQITKVDSTHLRIDWSTHPHVYYFVEGSNDLINWIPVKLFKDNVGIGSLTHGITVRNPKEFQRLSLEGDPHSARLRADDDGDKIINLLEANAGMDSFLAEDPTDSDLDGIPDYWELFHFGSLDHDVSYTATAGGLNVAEAYAAGTDPNQIDSDGDGESDSVEIANGTDPNYDETRDEPNGDYDEDGLTNAQEHEGGTFPKNEDSDDDNLSDDEDGWPRDKNFTHPRVSESYALIDLSSQLPHPSAGNYEGETFSVQVDDYSGVLLSYATAKVSQGSTTTRDLVNKYYNWSEVLTPPAFNGSKTVSEERSYPDSSALLYVRYPFRTHLSRSGIIRLKGSFLYDDFDYTFSIDDQEAFVAELKSTFATSNVAFDTQAETSAAQSVSTFPKDFLDGFIVNLIAIPELDLHHSEYADTTLSEVYVSQWADDTEPYELVTLVAGETVLYTGNVSNLGSVDIYGYEGGGFGGNGLAVFELKNYIPGSTHRYALISSGNTVTPLAHAQEGAYTVMTQDAQDILVRTLGAGPKEYSLDGGTTFHPAQVWNTSTRELETASFAGKTSDELVILQSNQTGILINGCKKTAEELLGHQAEGWTDFKLHDINSSGMIVGTALHSPQAGTNTRKVIALLKVDFVPDYDRNGVIREHAWTDDDGKLHPSDYQRAAVDDTFYFWVNDDDDDEPVEGDDIPGDGTADASNSSVDGIRDLIDFFPVYIDLHGLLDDIDLTKVRIELTGAKVNWLDFPENFIGLNENSANFYLEDQVKAEEWAGVSVTEAGEGVYFTQKMVERIRDGRGIVLLEGREAGDEPLTLVFNYDGSELFTYELPIKLSGVEDMFRHRTLVNTIGSASPSIVVPSRTVEPSGLPDSESNGNNFVLLHGYNVEQDAARGWHCEIFKRLYQSGSKAKFTGITWHGATGLNYHQAVINAFLTSEQIASALSSLTGEVTVAAHSLGNMVISSAIADHSFAPDRYFLVNAATPIESYDGSEISTNQSLMRNPDWANYEPRLWASYWYDLFSDSRNGLTWADRFGSISSRAYNFYSPGEDVVANAQGVMPGIFSDTLVGGGRFAWVQQEMIKGLSSLDGIVPWELIMPDQHGGWAIDGAWWIPDGPGSNGSGRYYSSSEAAALTSEQLRNISFFRRFKQSSDRFPIFNGLALYGPDGDSTANGQANSMITQYVVLSEAIPALSFAAAANPVDVFDSFGVRNYDMQSYNEGWPSDRSDTDWRHSDFKSIPYVYIDNLFKFWVELGNLD